MPEQIDAIDEVAMSFGDHLEELRRRLIHGLIGVAVAAGATLFFGQSIIAWLLVPLNRVQRDAGLPAMTVGHNVTTGFMIYLKVSIIAGVIIGSPWLIYQLWKFVSAGLYPGERRVVLLLTPFSASLSGLGIAFTYYLMLPVCLAFLIGFSTSYPAAGGTQPSLLDRMSDSLAVLTGSGEGVVEDGETQVDAEAAADRGAPAPGAVLVPILREDPAAPVDGQIWINAVESEIKVRYGGMTRVLTMATGALVTPLIDVEGYISFVTLMMLGVVVAFQLPLVMLVGGWTGVVDPALVSRYRGHCVFGCFVMGAVFTPADPVSMLVLAFPLWLLFEVGLRLMRRVYPKPELG